MVSIPEGNFVYTRRGAEIFPRFLLPSDHPWLSELLHEVDRSAGMRRGDLEERLTKAALGAAPEGLRRMAVAVLLDRLKAENRACVSSLAARADLFRREQSGVFARSAAIARAASALSVSAEELIEALFADLPLERRVLGLDPPLEVGELAIRVNLAYAQALLFRAQEVRLQLTAQARAVARQAQLGGLIIAVEDQGTSGARLVISGPLSLFRQTLIYGRALSRLLPLLAWAGTSGGPAFATSCSAWMNASPAPRVSGLWARRSCGSAERWCPSRSFERWSSSWGARTWLHHLDEALGLTWPSSSLVVRSIRRKQPRSKMRRDRWLRTTQLGRLGHDSGQEGLSDLSSGNSRAD